MVRDRRKRLKYVGNPVKVTNTCDTCLPSYLYLPVLTRITWMSGYIEATKKLPTSGHDQRIFIAMDTFNMCHPSRVFLGTEE